MVKVHQNLNGLKLYDYYDQENYYILVMEYGGKSLESIATCHKKKILNLMRYEAYNTNYFYSTYLLQIKLYMIKVYHKIKKMYNFGIHHNDLKLENILIDDVGQVNIIDFGVAKYVKPFYTEYTGTFEYIPYEYITTGKYKPWDHTLWCFGVMLHFLTLMKYPFLKDEDILNYNLDISQIHKLPSSFSNLILKCLDKNPENRPHNILEMLGNLCLN
jgi:serine/threonine protein kinase